MPERLVSGVDLRSHRFAAAMIRMGRAAVFGVGAVQRGFVDHDCARQAKSQKAVRGVSWSHWPLLMNRNVPSFDTVRMSGRPSAFTSATVTWTPTPDLSSMKCGTKVAAPFPSRL